MMIREFRFNLNLLLAVALPLGACLGCQTEAGKRRSQQAILRVHIEASSDAANRSQPVPVYREHPVLVTVDKTPFLTENNVKEAAVVDVVGGFALRVKLDKEGTWLLESYTGANRGRHLAIFTQVALPKGGTLERGRWLAAPAITQRMTDGVLTFTPDATREETEQVALGLNNAAKELQSPGPQW